MEKEKHLGLRIDAETHKKLKSLAEFEGRSINGEVLYLIRQAMLRGKNTGRDRKKVKKLIYYYLELIKKRVTNGQIAFFVLYGKCI